MTNDLSQERQLHELDARLSALAAEILRVLAGAGRPWEIPNLALEYSLSVQAAMNAGMSSTDIDAAVSAALDLEEAYYCLRPHLRDRAWGPPRHMNLVVKGALRYAAAEILLQRVQSTRGEGLVRDGMIAWRNGDD